jgi:putative transposase
VRIETDVMDPGKPRQNVTNPSINGMFRAERPSVDRFRTRREAQVIIEAWRRHCNTVQLHPSLGYLTPHEFKRDHPSIKDHPN